MTFTQYHERPFAMRMGAMGDKAEAAFLGRYPHAHRIGLDRPSFPVKGMAYTMRHTPDFMLPDGFYEVVGFSSRGNDTLKLKFEKLDALKMWTLLGPTYIWAWDSGRREAYCAPVHEWVRACHDLMQAKRFDDNDVPYWELNRACFPTGPT